MRRILFRLIGVTLFTCLEFITYPGHSYLQSGTQLTVPMLERLSNPGFLSRDLVATHANLEYTAYDETTLFLHQFGRVSIERALMIQQIAARAGGSLGILLLGVSAGLGEPLALAAAALLSLGGHLGGPNLTLVDSEAVPRALAWGAILLALGLLSRHKPLLGGLAGGIGLIYDPALAAPFCCVVVVALILDRGERRFLRPAITVLAVFVLLLANLAQLQPGVEDRLVLFEKIPAAYAAVERYRTPSYWVSLWPHGALWSYVAVWICGAWATTRIWPLLNRALRWFLVALPLFGMLGMLASYILLDRVLWPIVLFIDPAEWLAFTFLLAALACWIAAAYAARSKNFWEASLWLVLPIVIPFRGEVLELLRLTNARAALALLVTLLVAFAGSWLLRLPARGRNALGIVGVPLLVLLALQLMRTGRNEDRSRERSVVQLADWVKQNTWGSSMFLFADLGRSPLPGVFRAKSLRPLWVNWNDGALVPFSASFAATWWERWRQALQGAYAPARIAADLPLPIDYYVLTRKNELSGFKPVFANQCFVVYDANDLRSRAALLQAAVDR